MKEGSVETIRSMVIMLFIAVPLITGDISASEKPSIESSQSISGCGHEAIASGVYTMTHDGVARIYRVHVPAGYPTDAPAPVVAFFHGWGGTEDEFATNKVITDEADKHGYILVAPRGLGPGDPDNKASSWTFSGSATGLDGDGKNSRVAGDTDAICDHDMTPDYSYGSCSNSKSNSCAWTHCQADDVGFAVALVEEIKTRLCVDANRVFAMGSSNGGMYIWDLGRNLSSARHFKALAALVGLPHRGYLDAHTKNTDMPVIVVTGMQDNFVPPGEWDNPAFTTTSNGSDRYFYTGATAITRSWAKQHACDTTGKAQVFDDGYDESDCRTYCSDDPGWPRVLDCRAQMGHVYQYEWSWKLILDFFDAHSK